MVYYVFSSEKLLINHPLDSIVDLRVCPLPVRNWSLQLARQPGWPMEGSGGEAQAVGAPASWLFQAVSLPHRHQACLRDQGHRKRGSFPVFLLFLCEPLFRRATSMDLIVSIIALKKKYIVLLLQSTLCYVQDQQL